MEDFNEVPLTGDFYSFSRSFGACYYRSCFEWTATLLQRVLPSIAQPCRIALHDSLTFAKGGSVREQLAKLGSDALNMPPAGFDKFVRKEIDDYTRIARAAGIKPQ